MGNALMAPIFLYISIIYILYILLYIIIWFCYLIVLSIVENAPVVLRLDSLRCGATDWRWNDPRRHMQASISVALLNADGALDVPWDARVWIEVGCNNWELLHDKLVGRSDVYLLTFEPLVDKFAYLRHLARGHARHPPKLLSHSCGRPAPLQWYRHEWIRTPFWVLIYDMKKIQVRQISYWSFGGWFVSFILEQ